MDIKQYDIKAVGGLNDYFNIKINGIVDSLVENGFFREAYFFCSEEKYVLYGGVSMPELKKQIECLETKINLILNHLNLEVDYIPPTDGKKVLKKKKAKKTRQK